MQNFTLRSTSFFLSLPPHEHKKRSQLKSGLMIVLFLFSFIGFAQAQTPESKIDFVFKSLIAQKDKSADQRIVPVPYKIEPRDGFIPGGSRMESRYDCIVYTENAQALRDKGIIVISTLKTFVTAWVSLEQITEMSLMPQVKFIQAPEIIPMHNDLTVANTGATLLHDGLLNNTVYKGKGVITAILDSGIDWDHPDFREPADQTKSRILRIWDQTITPIAGETSPAPFGYGVEYTKAQIDDELDGTPTGFVREQDTNGHGTHVSGTVAGNGMALPTTRKYTGMAPEGDIVFIKGGNGSFSNTNIINGIAYLQALATTLGKPVVLNMSLGGQTGAHDGSLSHEQAIDAFTASAPGRVIVVSAGNDNGTNIHTTDNVTAGGTANHTFTVASAASGTDVFQYTVWADDATDFSASLTTPGATVVTVNAGQTAATSVTVGGGTFTVNMSNSIDVNNGDRAINVYIQRTSGDPAGAWVLSLTNNGASTVTTHGWLNYRATAYSGTTVSGGNSTHLTGSVSSATSAITVGSYVARLAWYSNGTPGSFNYTGTTTNDNISTFSSNGPRRDNVLKPEITTNGQAVISCLSSNITGGPTLSDVTEIGLYQKNQGTSMSSPGVAGAVALLLQANPTLTAAQVKTLLTSTATIDALTGAVPNTVWGYGKLNIFKAVSSTFSCTSNWKMFQYDNSFTSAQNLGVLFSTTRIAVRFTPDMTGKLAGIYYHTAATTSVTDLVAEIRTSNAGVPGTLLGTVNIPVANVGKYSWNYVDFSSLALPVTSGTDYFVVVMRSASSAANWSLTRENTALDNRSFASTDGGATWTVQTFDYRIRSSVYTNTQVTTPIVTANAADTRNVTNSNIFLSSCSMIDKVVPNGGTPVAGNVESRVWIEGAVPTHNSIPYVQRHYQITPASGASTATARVTLYFTQAEFTNFNNHPGSVLNLPIDATDVANNKANLRVSKLAGSSNNGTGLVGTYNSTSTIIDPVDSDIVWNSVNNVWEVSFDVNGFSGFVVQTNASPILPVTLEYFNGHRQAATNVLNWKANCNNVSTTFTIERSNNGANFSAIGSIASTGDRCMQSFTFTDATPLAGKNFYRLKMIYVMGSTKYSDIILLQTDGLLTNSVQPTFIPKGGNVQVSYATGGKGNFSISDATGRTVYNHSLVNGVQILTLPMQVSGIYFYSIKDEAGKVLAGGKIVVE